MNVKKGVTIFALIIIIIFILCDTRNAKEDPAIKATFTFSKLSDEDFKDIGTKNVTKEDFRKVQFSLSVDNCTNRKILIPNIKELMNSYDIERYWYGHYTSSDVPGSDAYYSYDIMFLANDLTDNNIKSIFDNAIINIIWQDNNGEEKSKDINLANIIEFK